MKSAREFTEEMLEHVDEYYCDRDAIAGIILADRANVRREMLDICIKWLADSGYADDDIFTELDARDRAEIMAIAEGGEK